MSEAATTPSPPSPGQKLNAYEAILRMCAREAPQPWFPRLYAQSAGISQESLYRYLEDLWLDGLVQKVEGSPETGPGLTLTPAGFDVLNDPAALQRLIEGRAVKPGDRGGIVREVVRRAEKPVVSRLLFGLNVVWFVYSLLLAGNIANALGFLSVGFLGNPNVPLDDILSRSGALSGQFWLAGQWWRLATSCFVHIGLLHIALNMNFLLMAGKVVEQMYGRVRFLVIYAFAGLGGGCLAVAMQPEALLAGASGALCGVIAAEAVWVLCNGRYLSRDLAARWRKNLMTNGFLILIISLIPGVSGWCHLGGALTGAFVALVMLVQRFGPPLFRWAVLLALVPLPWAGYAVIKYEQGTNPHWAQIMGNERSEEERTAFSTEYLKRIQVETYNALGVYGKAGILNTAPEERNQVEVDKVKHDLGEQREVLKQLITDLENAGPYRDGAVENARRRGLRFAQALEVSLTAAEKCLREGTEWTPQDKEKNRKMEEAGREWGKLFMK